MIERPKAPETPVPPTPTEEESREQSAQEERGVSFSERPTDPAPKKEKREDRLNVDSISLSKIFGVAINDDSYFENVDENGETGTFGVGDGMGGYPGGDVASQTIMEAVRGGASKLDEIAKRRAGGDMEASIQSEMEALRSLMYEADAQLEKKRGESPPLLSQMGTTGTIVRLTKDERGLTWAIVGQVGDSRAYLLHPDGRLETLTLDAQPALDAVRSIHGESVALRVQDVLDELLGREQLVALQLVIKEGEPFPEDVGVTKDDIDFLMKHMGAGLIEYYFVNRSTIQGAFGHHPQIKTKVVPIPPGSKIALCTDAISDGLLKREVRAILRGAYDELPDQGVKEAASMWGRTPAQALAFAAKERGEEHTYENFHPRSKGLDDATVVIVEVPKR
ncbi:MAG: protein phosphatase 2C domain-containing protein [Candidatus Uhrbacteria bacterium]|nr:protein phosphatase 2C domain-containing protein [Candidatus Uhrbacteria bacterium]